MQRRVTPGAEVWDSASRRTAGSKCQPDAWWSFRGFAWSGPRPLRGPVIGIRREHP
jgi:hypothetical protein